MIRGTTYAVETIGGKVWYSVTCGYRSGLVRRIFVKVFTGYRWPIVSTVRGEYME